MAARRSLTMIVVSPTAMRSILPYDRLFPKQCLHLGVLAELKRRAGKRLWLQGAHRTPPDTENVEKNNEFLSFLKKMVLALEF